MERGRNGFAPLRKHVALTHQPTGG
jgi:hypothetical protein